MPVIGCCNSPPNLVVISQYIPIGSLFQVLHEQVGNSQSQAVVVDTITALQFAHDIAKGMAFLHSLDRQMPRFHLNSKHVMVCRKSINSLFSTNFHSEAMIIRICVLISYIYVSDWLCCWKWTDGENKHVRCQIQFSRKG